VADIYVTTTGNDTTGDGSSGNPYATPGKAMGVAASGDTVYVKTGTYALTNSTANTAGGPVDVLAGVRLEGYGTTAGDLGPAPTITAGAQTSVVLVTVDGTYNSTTSACLNINVDGLSNSTVTGFKDNTHHVRALAFCKASNCTTGFNLTPIEGEGWAVACEAVACGTGFTGTPRSRFLYCWAKGCTTYGFNSNFSTFVNCIASGGAIGFNLDYDDVLVNCVADRNSSHGFLFQEHNIHLLVNCVATSNGGYGFNMPNAGTPMHQCGGYNNTSGNFNLTPLAIQQLTITADPWTSTTDFTPNATAGGGAVLREASVRVLGQTGYADIGAVQHQDAGGSTTISVTNVQPIIMGRIRAVGV
jgi:hypothetical protein